MIDTFKGEYSWASNFYPITFQVHGTTFNSSEHYFMACKTEDPEWCRRIMDAKTAALAKRLGRQCPLRPNWEKFRIGVMADALWYKFSQNPDIQAKLIETYPRQLMEGNYWHDNFWGNCLCPKCENIEGKNVLGILLMAHRNTLYTVRMLNV